MAAIRAAQALGCDGDGALVGLKELPKLARTSSPFTTYPSEHHSGIRAVLKEFRAGLKEAKRDA